MGRRINICIAVVITLSFIALGIFCYTSSYARLWESLGNFWASIRYYFCTMFSIPHEIVPTVTQYSDVLTWQTWLPSAWEQFKIKFNGFFGLFFGKDNFIDWGILTAKGIGKVMQVVAIVIPCILVLCLLIKRAYMKDNTDHNKDTRPLKVFKGITKVTVIPLRDFIRQYILFLREQRNILTLWAVIWVFNLNFASIIVDFFSYYFYFAVSFDFANLYTQICKLVIDIQVLFKTIPIWVLLIAAWILFSNFRKGIALSKLNRLERHNRAFINDLPLVSMTCGSMGKKKTTVITDMALSQEVMFRNIAFGKLKKTDLKYPYFPWISFEMEIKKCIEHGVLYNLATVKQWIELKRSRYEKHKNAELQLYGYDVKRYGLFFYDNLKTSYLFDVLETYAKLYFIYVIESSLIVANYSIREDNTLLDNGNFPLWQSNFFPEHSAEESRHAHILDFDILRLGRKVIESNPNNGSFEFGVVVISEVGKERGNNLELSELKKKTDETNQKNDLFNSWLKMCRHSATVDNYPFIKVFTDEQRPESWGADARDLCDIVNIVTSGEQKLSLPFYTLEEMISEWTFDWFINLYYDFRFRRGDNTLLIYFLKSITAALYKRNMRIYNKYGFSILRLEKERGTMDGQILKKHYNIMNQKIYSRRFSTDCFSDYFNDMAKNTRVGLEDYFEYETEKASINELKLQNSYFINALYKDTDNSSR